MLMLNGVPNFTGILIHMGVNKENTEGCILVGSACYPEAGILASSEDAYQRVYTPIAAELLAGHDVWITIHDGDALRAI